jgi:hypothetical protein
MYLESHKIFLSSMGTILLYKEHDLLKVDSYANSGSQTYLYTNEFKS